MPERKPLVSQHLEKISSEMLEQYQSIIRDYVRDRPGVYALYRQDEIYYVGLASDLRIRLAQHMKDRHHALWDKFSVYLTTDDSHIREMESLILRILKPPGNRRKGKFARSEDLRPRVMRDFKAGYSKILVEMFGEQHPVKNPGKSEVKPRRCPIVGLVDFIYELKQKGKTLEQVIEAGRNGPYPGLADSYFRDRWNKAPRGAKAYKLTNSIAGRAAFIRKLREDGNDWTTAWEKIRAEFPRSSIGKCKEVWDKDKPHPRENTRQGDILVCRRKGAMARGHRIPDSDGFLVLKGSTAVLREYAAAEKWPNSIARRKQLIEDGTLVEKDDLYEFTTSIPFTSPSAAAAVIHGGPANGLVAWKTEAGKTLKELDELRSQAA